MPASAKQKSDAFYKISVDLINKAKIELGRGKIENLEDALGAYLSLLVTEEEKPETVEVGSEILTQMALLASASLSRIICERYRQRIKHE